MTQGIITDDGIADKLLAKIKAASNPLKIAEAVKGIAKPKKVSAADWASEIQTLLDEKVRAGQLFSYPSGSSDTVRYWDRDEKQLLRDRLLAMADSPQTIATLKKQLGSQFKGTAPAFIESIIREMIGAELLFEHPGKTARSGCLYGTRPAPPPPPILEQAKHSKAVDKIVDSCRKLLTTTGVSVQILLEALQKRLGGSPSVDTPAEQRPVQDFLSPTPEKSADSSTQGELAQPSLPQTPADSSLAGLILKAVDNAFVLDLAELRQEMPPQFQGSVFDETVLRLAEESKVILSQDVNPVRFTPEQRRAYVRYGECLFITIARRTDL